MDIALDSRHQDFALRLGFAAVLGQQRLFRFQIGGQDGDRFLHDASGLDHLWQEHLSGAEKVADHIHAFHQRTFDDQQGATQFFEGFQRVGFDMVGDSSQKRVPQTFLHRTIAPFFRRNIRFFARALHRFGEGDQALGGVRATVE